MADILLHICCAPCLCWPHQALSDEGISFTGLWFNPNIHPYNEYRARRASVKTFSEQRQLEVVYHDEYPLEETLDLLGKDRCAACYRIRLERTARYAKEHGFLAFSTTLLYSIYQQHDLIRKIGRKAGSIYNVEFHYRDFRPGWRQGREIARAMGLYRQKYCGCIFSERDRYLTKTTPRHRSGQAPRRTPQAGSVHGLP
ncbi:MAG: epoxyqueuosine reductase QueH [Candidatus Edwardsbacteria bacterium]|nr:epoxyqueuosine reductase QueH [Candidatus Edwardsbacteria bacterium]